MIAHTHKRTEHRELAFTTHGLWQRYLQPPFVYCFPVLVFSCIGTKLLAMSAVPVLVPKLLNRNTLRGIQVQNSPKQP